MTREIRCVEELYIVRNVEDIAKFISQSLTEE